MLLDYNIELKKTTGEETFYRLNIGNKAKIWFSDHNSPYDNPVVYMVYVSLIAEELKGFEVFVNTEDNNFYYSSTYMNVPHISLIAEEVEDFINSIKTASDICETIDNFFKEDFLKIRKGEV